MHHSAQTTYSQHRRLDQMHVAQSEPLLAHLKADASITWRGNAWIRDPEEARIEISF